VCYRISLPLCLTLLLGCTDVEFDNPDGGVTADRGSGTDKIIWPDAPKKPDGIKVSDPRMMYAHSREELYSISPSNLKLSLKGKFSFAPAIPVNERSINDIAMTGDDRLFAITKTFIYEVNVKTVKTTKVAQVQASAKTPPLVALTFEKSGMLLGSDMDGALYRIYYSGTGGKPKGTVVKLGTYGQGLGSSGDLVATKSGTMYGVSQKGAGATDTNNKMIEVRLPKGSGGGNNLATPGCKLGHGKVWGLAFWAGTIYGFTRGDNKNGKMISIKPDGGDVTKTCTVKVIKTYPYEFWGAAVSPLAPIK